MRETYRTLFPLCLVLATLGIASTASAGPHEDEAGCSWNGQTASVRVAWQRAQRTDGCFFFSGPADLGRDDHLGSRARWVRRGSAVELRFGALVFSGRISGDRVTLQRVSTHRFGSGWRVTELILGRLVERNSCVQLVASYHYDECPVNGIDCPGRCHIDAAFAAM